MMDNCSVKQFGYNAYYQVLVTVLFQARSAANKELMM